MKNNKALHILSIIAIIAAASLSITSCKKKSDNAATGTFYFHIHSNIDTVEVDDTAEVYNTADGKSFGITAAHFFISNITLTNANGGTYTFPNTYVLESLDSEEYLIGTAPVGTYTSVSFNVGVDDAANATTPSSHPSASVLSDAWLWFGSTAQGYNFMSVDAFTQNGSLANRFSYKIGASRNLKKVTMPVRSGSGTAPYILTAGGAQYIHLIADYGKLLSPFLGRSTDTYTTNPSLAVSVAAGIPNMFTYEE